ncbi:MAG: acyltransferase family protein [Sphingobium sp.]
MKYRTDIDGLRAIAVMAVVVFHAGVQSLHAGYLGVDIFYVISGFLITGIIQHEIADSAFSLAGFYRRRIVRIFPALFLMLTAVLAVACLVAMPPDIVSIASASAAAAGFVSNIHFWLTTGYFDDAAQWAPLLHTWSLGVEEQFYILYPFVLLLLARGRKNPKWALIVLTVISFGVAVYLRTLRNEADFYLLPSRAWQLGLGALVAVGLFPRLRALPALGLAATGLAMLVASFFVKVPEWMIEGVLPSVGAALVIAYGNGSLVHRLLAVPPLRWLGAISYSLYLWHWPIMTFFRLHYGLDLTLAQEAGLIVASILIAAISYYLVEQPTLKHFRNAEPRKAILIGLTAIACMVSASLAIARHPNVRNVPAEAVRVAAYVNYAKTPERIAQTRADTCFIMRLEDKYDQRACASIIPNEPNIALIGDSHAAQYWQALARRFPHDNIMEAAGAGCTMLYKADDLLRCRDVRQFAFGRMLERGHIDGVILVARWTDHHLPVLARTIRLLRNQHIPVLVIGPIEEYATRFPIALGKSIEMHNVHYVDQFRRKSMEALDRRMRQFALREGVSYYSATDAECKGGACAYVNPRDGVPLHFDYGHTTESGAEYELRNLNLPAAFTQSHAPLQQH